MIKKIQIYLHTLIHFHLQAFCGGLCWIFVAVCGLSLVSESGGYSLVMICRLLMVASLAVEHSLQNVWV